MVSLLLFCCGNWKKITNLALKKHALRKQKKIHEKVWWVCLLNQKCLWLRLKYLIVSRVFRFGSAIHSFTYLTFNFLNIFFPCLFRAAAAAIAAQTATERKNSRKIPPPLLRSRTLPAIIVPGISILHTQLNPSRLAVGE